MTVRLRSDGELFVPLGAALRRAAPPRNVAGLEALQRTWQREVDAAVKRWVAEVWPQQLASLARQIEQGVQLGDLQSLAAAQAPVLGAEQALTSMRTMAAAGADSVIKEAKRQGVQLEAPPPLAAVSLTAWAHAAARVLADSFAGGVVREALRLFRPGRTAAEVSRDAETYVEQLTDAGLRYTLGGVLTQAQNLGRLQVYGMTLPPGVSVDLMADETLDANTCAPCRAIDGTILPTPEAAALAYGGAGYLYCKGRERCRGTVVGHWEQRDPARDQFMQMRSGLSALRHDA